MGILSDIYQKTRNFILEVPMQEVKNKMFDISFPVFAEYDRDRRNFFSMLATISATIGAFSFLLFSLSNVVKNFLFLKIGDGLLLLTIILSIISYLYTLRDNQKGFHKVFYDSLEIFNNKKYEEFPKYKRPKIRGYWLEFIICFIFILALVFIGVSFF